MHLCICAWAAHNGRLQDWPLGWLWPPPAPSASAAWLLPLGALNALPMIIERVLEVTYLGRWDFFTSALAGYSPHPRQLSPWQLSPLYGRKLSRKNNCPDQVFMDYIPELACVSSCCPF